MARKDGNNVGKTGQQQAQKANKRRLVEDSEDEEQVLSGVSYALFFILRSRYENLSTQLLIEAIHLIHRNYMK